MAFIRQHAEDEELLKKGIDNAPITYRDEIPLQHKLVPSTFLLTREQKEKQKQQQQQSEGDEEKKCDDWNNNNETVAAEDCVLFSSRGFVDVSLLQDLVNVVEEGYDKIPLTQNHQREKQQQQQQQQQQRQQQPQQQQQAEKGEGSNNYFMVSFWVVTAVVVLYLAYKKQYIMIVAVLFPLLSIYQNLGGSDTSPTKSVPVPPQQPQQQQQQQQRRRQQQQGLNNTNSAQLLQKINRKHEFTPADVKSTTNLWDTANAAINNVALWRPSHDEWGIGKIVLIFCDDFMRQIYEMPWWHLRPDIQEAVRPIFELLNLTTELPPTGREQQEEKHDGEDKNIIVRMIFACLPPGGTIPVHSDTGEWVKYAHRIHVPIICKDPDNILFRVGITPQTMGRIDCRPGHVFELNNQCKHAVSNCSEDHRVHLIMDYISEKQLRLFRQHYCHTPNAALPKEPTIKLHPGEPLRQTKRSIDRLSDKGSRQDIPYFLTLGSQKSGTTSLYEYMMQHPLIARPIGREPHSFDWSWPTPERLKQFINTMKNNNTYQDDESDDGEMIEGMKVSEIRKYIQHHAYRYDQLQYFPSLVIGCSTPSYIVDSYRVIPRLKKVCPWEIKFFAIVRDPVKRAYSHFNMMTSYDKQHAQIKVSGASWHTKTFQEAAIDDIYNMKNSGLLPYWDIEKGVHDDKVFQEFAGSPEEDVAWEKYLQMHIPIHSGMHSLIARGLYELNLRPWFKAYDDEEDNELFCILNLDNMMSKDVNTTLKLVWEHLHVPEQKIQDTAPKHQREYSAPLDPDFKQYLQRFYKPHNQRLGEILRKRLQDKKTTAMKSSSFYSSAWQGDVWKYD